jgi:NADP-dependent 3-hydroxy acid dehydrogenase YdfG
MLFCGAYAFGHPIRTIGSKLPNNLDTMGVFFSGLVRHIMGKLFSENFDPSTDLPHLTGKVMVVTGGNTGVGYSTIKHLARRGAKVSLLQTRTILQTDTMQVYMASRSDQKIAAALKKLETEGIGNGEVVPLKLDLGDPRKAKAAAEEFLTLENRLDVLSKLLHR